VGAGLISAERAESLFTREDERRVNDLRVNEREVLRPALAAAGIDAVIYWPLGFPPKAPLVPSEA
jgi:hypothetical protein